MELKYFRLIKTIEEEGNIANSSERLFLTQSALSHQLRVLEEQLGFKVFIRTRNQWELTKEGKELYQLANQLFDTIEKGFKNIKQIKDGSKGKIRVSAECMSFFHGLPALIQKMGVLYPDIQIDLKVNVTQQVISKILADEVDIAIVTSKPTQESLIAVEVYEDEIFAVLHKEHTLCENAFLEASHFSNIHLIINSFPLESVAIYQHFLKQNHIIPKKISAIPFTEVSLELVKANLGILTAPKWQLNSFKNIEELALKRISQFGLKRTHYLIVKKENRFKKYIHDFIQNFEEQGVCNEQ